MLDAVDQVSNLVQLGARFDIDQGTLVLGLRDLTFRVTSWEEIYILDEIFVRQTYGFQPSGDFVTIDIGSNAGFSSLYFSSMKQCKAVYAFELSADTYKMALQNLEINACASKIKHYNVGLGYPAREMELFYNKDLKGGFGIGHTNKLHPGDRPVKVQIVDPKHHIEQIFNHHEERVILKMDCEGAESEILNRLFEIDLLSRMSVCMIEWHGPTKEPIISILHLAGFAVISTSFDDNSRGLVYAFNSNR